jgi:hypothetical protein
MPKGIYERKPSKQEAADHPNGNGPRPWGRITEVTPDEIPVVANRRFKYLALYEDLALRLEQTSPPLALKVPLATAKEAKAAAKGIQIHFGRTRGEDSVRVQLRGADVYVSRGPNWK